MSTSFSSGALLPAFDPTSTPSSPSNSTAAPHFPRDSPPLSPQSSISNFFSRSRSNSLHSSSSSVSRTHHKSSEAVPPPVPSIPSTYSTSSSTDSNSFRPPVLQAHIKSVSVPHHAKSGGKWVFACRVVPDGCSGGSQEAVAMSRAGSLGRMQIAGAGQEGASEPHTVWRTWGEFVEFSSRLSAAFPFVSPTPGAAPTSSSTSDGLPSSFYRQTPRLTRKLTLFVTRSTLLQRQDDLDLFVRRLFEMPAVIKQSTLVREFFRIREHDLHGTAASGDSSSPASPLEDEVDPFARFLTDVYSPNATIRAPATKPKTRPSLGVKHSTPDLRKLMVSDAESIFDVPAVALAKTNLRRPILAELRTVTLDDNVRSSAYSASSNATVTPATVAAASARLPSPLNTRSPLPQTFMEIQEPASAPPQQTVAKARHQGLLRHFYSLQDLRGQQALTNSRLQPPTSAADMNRSRTQPPPLMPMNSDMSRAASTGRRYHHQQRQRSGSKSSSSSSFEDASGSSYGSVSSGGWPSGMRQGPSGRPLDRVAETSQRSRRPSTQGRSYSNTKASIGHSHSPSSSSIGSSFSSAGASDMSRSMSSPGGYLSSRRSSTEYSDLGSYGPGTPPTPQFDAEFSSGGKYFVSENGVLSQNNKVPLPPFFPVPPSMSSVAMQSAYSQDGLPHSPRPSHHRKRSSGESRSRATSAASCRPHGLDLIPGSPGPLTSSISSARSNLSCASSSTSAVSSPNLNVRPQDRPTLTFKILHTESNFNIRVPRLITLAELRTQIESKFAQSCSVRLGGENGEGQWALSYMPGRGNKSTEPAELIATEEDFQVALKMTEDLEKVSLRIVS